MWTVIAKVFVLAIVTCASPSPSKMEQEVQRKLEQVLNTHMSDWKERKNVIETFSEEEVKDATDSERHQRSGFPTIKKKRKKIRSCQNMAGR